MLSVVIDNSQVLLFWAQQKAAYVTLPIFFRKKSSKNCASIDLCID